MIDIDNFKSINDRQGHQAGDTVLKDVAQSLRSSIGPLDRLFRYGGEEFVVICENRSLASAAALADAARKAVELELESEPGIPVTVSIGVAGKSRGPVSVGNLVRQADARLYEAKRSGKNRVVGGAE